MTPSDFNDFIRESIDWLGWFWWGPTVVLAAYNLGVLYVLDAPASLGARMARVFMILACVLMVGVPWYNSLGMIALPVLIVSCCVINTQFWVEERNRRKRLESAMRRSGLGSLLDKRENARQKLVTAMVGHKNTRNWR